jgi:hypothetical protein
LFQQRQGRLDDVSRIEAGPFKAKRLLPSYRPID